MQALTEIGLMEEALAITVPLRGRMVHDRDGSTVYVPYGNSDDEQIYSIRRHDVNALLYRKAPVVIRTSTFIFDQRLVQLDKEHNRLWFEDEGSREQPPVASRAGGSADRRGWGLFDCAPTDAARRAGRFSSGFSELGLQGYLYSAVERWATCLDPQRAAPVATRQLHLFRLPQHRWQLFGELSSVPLTLSRRCRIARSCRSHSCARTLPICWRLRRRCHSNC